MTDRADAARSILAVPLFTEIMDGLEQDAMNSAVHAKYEDHEARQAHMAEVRAIRNLRSKLAVISKEDQASERKQAPA
jgi:anti-sigma factor RsiW